MGHFVMNAIGILDICFFLGGGGIKQNQYRNDKLAVYGRGNSKIGNITEEEH